MPTLEQQLVALCEAHGLSSLAIHVSVDPDAEGPRVYSTAHGDGKCAYSAYDPTGGNAISAIGSAIGELNAKRFPPVAEVADLAPLVGEVVA